MNGNKYKILIIEDDEHINNLVATLLEANGYQTLSAYSCEDGKMCIRDSQIYHWRKKSSAIEGLNIFGNIMFVVVRHGKSFLYFNLCIQYKGFGKNNQPCFCHKNLLNYDTKQEEKNGRVYEFCAGLRPVYG